LAIYYWKTGNDPRISDHVIKTAQYYLNFLRGKDYPDVFWIAGAVKPEDGKP